VQILEQEDAALNHQWKLRIERAQYEAKRAERQYDACDPDNRIVARTLETRWNEKLAEVERVEREHQDLKHRRRLELNDLDRQRILGPADDLPKLWRSDKTTDRDRKVLLRLLVQEVSATKIDVPRQVLRLRLLWRHRHLLTPRPAPSQKKNAAGFTSRARGNCLPVQGGQTIMNLAKRIGFGRFFFGFASVAAVAGATGCASSGGLGEHEALGVAAAQPAGVRAGAARVVDSRVNPQVPVRLTVEGEEVAVRFGHSRTGGAVAHLDRTSLAPVSPESELPSERPVARSSETARVVFSDGRFIVCWKSGDFERGYRVMAQAWTGGGEPIGAPVAISPADSDVLGAPQVVSLDGGRSVATFATFAEGRAELLAVPLQVL